MARKITGKSQKEALAAALRVKPADLKPEAAEKAKGTRKKGR